MYLVSVGSKANNKSVKNRSTPSAFRWTRHCVAHLLPKRYAYKIKLKKKLYKNDIIYSLYNYIF